MHHPIQDGLEDALDRAAELLRSATEVAVLTGAGVSAESGLATFRGAGGLWEGHRVEDVAETWNEGSGSAVLGLLQEHFAEADDMVQRRAQLVAEMGLGVGSGHASFALDNIGSGPAHVPPERQASPLNSRRSSAVKPPVLVTCARKMS